MTEEKIPYERTPERATILRLYGSKIEWDARRELLVDKEYNFSMAYKICSILSCLIFITGLILVLISGTKEELSVIEAIRSQSVLFLISGLIAFTSFCLSYKAEEINDDIYLCDTRIAYYENNIENELNSLREKGYF